MSITLLITNLWSHCYSKWGPGAAPLDDLGTGLEMQDHRRHPDLLNQNPHFNKAARRFLGTFKCESIGLENYYMLLFFIPRDNPTSQVDYPCGLRMLPAILVNKGYCSHQPLQQPAVVSPEGTRDGNRNPATKLSAAAATATPAVHPEETQDEKAQDTGPR